MKKTILLMLFLGGCISAQDSGQRAYEKFKGRPIETVMAVWGPPALTAQYAEGTIYTWTRAEQFTSTQSTTTTGTIGTTPFSATTETPVSTTIGCSIAVHVKQGRILGFRGDGANGPCATMYDMLAAHQ